MKNSSENISSEVIERFTREIGNIPFSDEVGGTGVINVSAATWDINFNWVDSAIADFKTAISENDIGVLRREHGSKGEIYESGVNFSAQYHEPLGVYIWIIHLTWNPSSIGVEEVPDSWQSGKLEEIGDKESLDVPTLFKKPTFLG